MKIIVVNDRSTDKSEAVVKAWMAENAWRFTRTVLLTNVKNYGLATSRNTGFQVARNEFVFVLDADNQVTRLANRG